MSVAVERRSVEAEPVVTSCGRRIAVGSLRVDLPSGPAAERVTLDVGPERGGTTRIWAGLTPAEAREVAHRLLEQAARAEAVPGGAGLVEAVTVGEGWAAMVRGRVLFTASRPGGARGGTPLELLAGSVAVCAADRAERYLRTRGMDADGLRVRVGYDTLDDRPGRITALEISVTVAGRLDAAHQAALRGELARCPVTSTLRQPPHVGVRFP